MDSFILDTVQIQAIAPTAVIGAVATAVAAGDALQIKEAASTYMLPPFGHHQVTGYLQLGSNAMHDRTALTLRNLAAQPYPLLPATAPLQTMSRLDTVTANFSGSAVGGQIETAVIPFLYKNPASKNVANLITAGDLRTRGNGQLVTVVSTHAGGVAGGYSAPILLNAATFYSLVSGRNYALVGATVDTVCAAVTIRGAGTGQARVAIPGNPTNKNLTTNYLYWLSLVTGFPTMPVINGNEAGQTTVEIVCNQAGGAFIVQWCFMQLN